MKLKMLALLVSISIAAVAEAGPVAWNVSVGGISGNVGVGVTVGAPPPVQVPMVVAPKPVNAPVPAIAPVLVVPPAPVVVVPRRHKWRRPVPVVVAPATPVFVRPCFPQPTVFRVCR